MWVCWCVERGGVQVCWEGWCGEGVRWCGVMLFLQVVTGWGSKWSRSELCRTLCS